jgi:hypothetical protein
MDRETMYILHDFMNEIIKNSNVCQNCAFCSCDNLCFFAKECLTNDFSLYKGCSITIKEKTNKTT